MKKQEPWEKNHRWPWSRTMMLWFIMGVIVGVVLAIFTIGIWISAKRS
jgi:uncharacterized membrane protein YoaK (UPF0700 family)